MPHMNIDTAFSGLMIVTTKLSKTVVWLSFMIIHLTLAILLLALAWWMKITPDSIQSAFVDIFLHSPFSRVWQTATTLGLSLGAVLLAYAKCWQWFLRKLLDSFIFHNTI